MQLSNRTAYVKLAAIMAVIGAIAAAGFAFRSPAHYTSTATLRMDPPKDASLPKDYGPRLAATQVELMRQEILSRSSLAEMIQRPSLNLYRAERYRLPMEDIIQRMRRDIRVSAAAGNDGGPVTLEVSFTYPDRVKAQAVVREVTTRFNEQNFAVNRNRALLWRNAWQEAAPPGPTLQVLSSASDPAARGPDYFVWAAAGALSGLLLGLLAVSLRRQPARTFQLAGCAFAGFGLAGAASYYFVDDTYTSTAVMRMIEPLDPKRWYPGQPHVPVSGRIQQLEQNVLSLANLQKLILRPSLDLYVARRRASPIEQVAADMRDRSIRIEMLPKQLGSASGDAFRISFRYYDRFKTQAWVPAEAD